MSFLTGLESWWATTEADVIAFIAQVKAEAPIIEADVAKVFSWINSEIPTAIGALTQTLGALHTVQSSGLLPIPASLLNDATEAVAALTAYQSTVAAGANPLQAAVAGYAAIKFGLKAAGVSVSWL